MTSKALWEWTSYIISYNYDYQRGLEGGKKGGRNCSLKHSSVGFFQLLLFAEEPTAETCHSALEEHLTLLSPPCTWCVFAAVLITLTSVFINILNQCRRLC